MKLEFGYGQGTQTVVIPDQNLKEVLSANTMQHSHIGADAVRYALQSPIGAPRLRQLVKPEQSVAIVVSDISRPVPSSKIVPAILEELFMAGCEAKNIKIVFALGSHRNQTEKEKRKLVGDLWSEQTLAQEN